MSAQTGNVRDLVPFFIPGRDDINETLTSYVTPSTPSSAPTAPVALSVREWDHAEGFFRSSVRLVHDHPALSSSPASSPSRKVSPSTPTRLLTPAGIRQARRTSPSRTSSPPAQRTSPRSRQLSSSKYSTSPVRTPATSPSPSRDTYPVVLTTPSPGSHKSNPSSPSHVPSSPGADSAISPKTRRFAGSSFETASPPPSNLPLPAFRRASPPVTPRPPVRAPPSCIASPPLDETHQRELAALELRRMLRI